MPADGDDLVFGIADHKGSVNDILGLVNTVTISESGYDITSTIGEAMEIGGGIAYTSSGGISSWGMEVFLGASQTFSQSAAGGLLLFYGTFSGRPGIGLNGYTPCLSGSNPTAGRPTTGWGISFGVIKALQPTGIGRIVGA